MRILVQKFGGSSVADLECMKKVRTKVLAAREEGYKVVVVLSARAGQTNSLLERAYQWSDEPDLAELDVLLTTGEQESVAPVMRRILAKFFTLGRTLSRPSEAGNP